MRDYERQEINKPSLVQPVVQGMRVLGGVLGILLMVVGLVFIMRLFSVIFGVMQDPSGIQETLGQWREVVGGADLNIALGGAILPLAHILALAAMGIGTFMLLWISTKLLIIGKDTIGTTMGNRKSVQQMVKEAIAKSKAPPSGLNIKKQYP